MPEKEETAAVFQELLIQNEECVKALIAHQEQHTEAWELAAEFWQQRWKQADEAFQEEIARLEQRVTWKTSPFAPNASLFASGDRLASSLSAANALGDRFGELGQRATCKAPPCPQGSRVASSSGDEYNGIVLWV